MDAVIRKAVETDAEQVGSVHYRAWMETYTDLLPEKILAGRSVEKSIAVFRKSKCSNLVVAEISGEIVGFCGWGEFRENIGSGTRSEFREHADGGGKAGLRKDTDGGPMGEIQGIYLLDAYKRKHLGKRMMDHAVEQLKNCGCRTVGLWVLDTNESAIRFYEKLGFQYDGIIQKADFDESVTELLYTKKTE